MRSVSVTEAKAGWSALIASVEEGRESEIVTTVEGRPAVRIVPVERRAPGARA